MVVIIAGSRWIKDPRFVEEAIKASGWNITEVVSGTAKGTDTHGENWARANGIPVTRFRPNWNEYGQRAGLVRNEEMAKYAKSKGGGLIAVFDGKSKGTKHMIWRADIHKLPKSIYNVALPDFSRYRLPDVTTGDYS